MAGTSISSQLNALKSKLNAASEPEPGNGRAFKRASVLFDEKTAADISLDTIFDIALTGLEVLITKEERFRNYKCDLFSHQSKELDRGLLGQEENKGINASISSYLRLLSGYLELTSALETLEFLIRRYKVNEQNKEDLILCALPYHDTHVFVKILNLINTGNSKWMFLDGVKASGAPLPRKDIVEHCVKDMGVLEAICNYAIPAKKIQPSKQVIGFSTAVIFEVIERVTVDSDIVKRILPYVSSGLQPGATGQNQKAGSLMIVSLLAQKSALASNVVRSLLHSVAVIARVHAEERGDLQWLRMSFMTLITIVQYQFQYVESKLIPKKTLDVLSGIRDISGILSGLTLDFNIDAFIVVFLDSLLEFSASDNLCHCTLLSIIETGPINHFIGRIVSRFLERCMKISQGSQGKEILVSIFKKYPNESREAFYSFLKGAKKSKKVHSSYDLLCQILDEHLGTSQEIPYEKIIFALEHPEAEIRKSAVLGLDVANILKEKAAGSKKFDAIQDALLRRLNDDDLDVVLAVLKLKNLPEMLSKSHLNEALQCVLERCIETLLPSSSTKISVRSNVALSCLQQIVINFKDQEQYAMMLAAAIFPLLLIRPKTQAVNLKAMELAKKIKWPFYENLAALPAPEKKLELGHISSTNFENICKLAETFSSSPEEYLAWLVKCCSSHELSRTLFLLVLLESVKMLKMDVGQFSAFFDSCFPILRSNWEMLESQGISSLQSKKRILSSDCKGILEKRLDSNISDVNAEILACLFLRLSETIVARNPKGMKGSWESMIQDLFVFFACHCKDIYRTHLDYLFANSKLSPLLAQIMLKLFTVEGVPCAAQIEGLLSFTRIYSQLDESSALQITGDFLSILVPLSSDNQSICIAAMTCIEEMFTLWSNNNNGNSRVSLHIPGELLRLIIRQKKLILSDKNVLANVLVEHAIGKRLEESRDKNTLEVMLNLALRLPDYAKLKILSLLKGVGSKIFSVAGVRMLLKDLLDSHSQYYHGGEKLNTKLSQREMDILCLLLESCTRSTSSNEAKDFVDFILMALEVNCAEETAVVEPCLTILRNHNFSSYFFGYLEDENQVDVLKKLLSLFRSANGSVQNSARDTLLRINLSCSLVERVLDSILSGGTCSVGSATGKKPKKSRKRQDPYQSNEATLNRKSTFFLLGAFLDVLLMKKNIDNRASLIGPLFKLLNVIFTNDAYLPKAADQDIACIMSSGSPQVVSDSAAYIQQTLLLTLEDICASFGNGIPQKDIIHNIDLQLLVHCARSSSDAVTCNHAFSLITTLVKIVPDKIMEQFFDVLTAIAESTVTQWDSFSQRVFEGLISAIIPCWLSGTGNLDQLLQIFVNILPQVAGHRRHSIITHILRTLGEAESLCSLLFLLFRSLISRNSLPSLLVSEHSLDNLTFVIVRQWEYEFSVQLCEQYSCTVWLPSLILALQKIGSSALSEETFMQVLVAAKFVADKLRDPEISYKLELDEDLNSIQTMVGELMEQVVYHLQLVDQKKKHIGVPAVIKAELKGYIRNVIKTLTKGLLPFTYFNTIIKLVGHADRNVRKKALGLLCETVKDLDTTAKPNKKDLMSSLRSSWLHLNESSQESFDSLCLKILTLLDVLDDVSSTSLKLAAVSALEVLADRFPSHDTIFSRCLGCVSKTIGSHNSALSSHCLRATGALVNALGPRALPELPSVMECVLSRSHDVSLVDSLFMSILVTLEAVIDKLAGFLNPYLGDILRLVVLHPLSFSSSDLNLKLKADSVRKLITEKVSVRLVLPPVLSLYSDAIKSGESSISIVFEMLGNLVNSMDRSSIGAYHARVFDLCLLALDLRHQNPASIQNIDDIERNVINAVVNLTMKLTETMFRPLFLQTIEWAGLNEESNGRAISFYNLVDKLAESHRSLFVPYFEHLHHGFVRGLVDAEHTETSLTPKKKKAKLSSNTKDREGALSLQAWHLRALILSSLHKCFLYDTGSSKFLDSSKFQALLKPIVSQLVVDPPVSIDDHLNVPSVKEVDDLLVACVGQMAITAGSDLLWKPLNHEVLMQTRSEKMRARILGLRIVRCLVENLKEEYLQFLPETIPFLGELLEDSELAVKSLAQEILKEMETLSGESLREYL